MTDVLKGIWQNQASQPGCNQSHGCEATSPTVAKQPPPRLRSNPPHGCEATHPTVAQQPTPRLRSNPLNLKIGHFLADFEIILRIFIQRHARFGGTDGISIELFIFRAIFADGFKLVYIFPD